MSNKIIIISLIVTFLIGCDNAPNVTINTIEDNTAERITLPDEFSICQPMDNLIKDLSIIKLETTPESVLGQINKIIVSKSNIYIYDATLNYGPAIFDINGKFIKRLEYGQAPHEIGRAQNIFFDDKSNKLYVFDADNCKIVKYNQNGEFESSHYLKYSLRDFMIIDSTIICIQTSNLNYIEQMLILKEDTINNNTSMWQMGKEKYELFKTLFLQQCDDGININFVYDQNVYSYKDDRITVKYQIDNKSNMDLSKYENEWDMAKEIGDNEYIYRGECIETANYLYLHYLTKAFIGPWSTFIFRNKTTKKMTPRIDKDNSLISLIKIHGIQQGNNDVFVGVIDPSIIFKNPIFPNYCWDGSNPNNLLSNENMEKMKETKEDDNPIIVLLKLKDDV